MIFLETMQSSQKSSLIHSAHWKSPPLELLLFLTFYFPLGLSISQLKAKSSYVVSLKKKKREEYLLKR